MPYLHHPNVLFCLLIHCQSRMSPNWDQREIKLVWKPFVYAFKDLELFENSHCANQCSSYDLLYHVFFTWCWKFFPLSDSRLKWSSRISPMPLTTGHCSFWRCSRSSFNSSNITLISSMFRNIFLKTDLVTTFRFWYSLSIELVILSLKDEE